MRSMRGQMRWLPLLLIAVLCSSHAHAAEEEPAPAGKLSLMTIAPVLTPVSDYRGDLWRRTTLLGDLAGRRQELYEQGIALDLAMTQVAQGVVSGGKDTGWQYDGLVDYTLSLDSGRLGLWPGGLLVVHAQTSYGDNVLADAGVVSPVSHVSILPVPGNENVTYLSEYYLWQGLSEWLVAVVGRMDLAGLADTTRFASSEQTQFLNTSMRVNTLLGYFVPLVSSHVVGAQIQPHPSFGVLPFVADADDQPGAYGSVGGLFNEISTGYQATATWEILGRSGSAHQVFIYSTKDTADLDNPHLVPELIRGLDVASKGDNWAVTINFDQYLYMPDGASGSKAHTTAFDIEPEGVGLFFRFGYTPEDRNPWNIFVSGGIGGRGVIPDRPLDRYGLGFFSMIESSDLDDQPLLGGALGTEWGMEVFYNVAITPWLQVSPDLQYVESGLPGVDDSVILAMRMQLYF